VKDVEGYQVGHFLRHDAVMSGLEPREATVSFGFMLVGMFVDKLVLSKLTLLERLLDQIENV